MKDFECCKGCENTLLCSDIARCAKALVPAFGSATSVLRELEWSKTYSYCTGWPCCPICKGVKPGYGADEAGNLPDNQGHRDGCRLAAALSGQNIQDQPTNPAE
jgi:hypothetical protein